MLRQKYAFEWKFNKEITEPKQYIICVDNFQLGLGVGNTVPFYLSSVIKLEYDQAKAYFVENIHVERLSLT